MAKRPSDSVEVSNADDGSALAARFRRTLASGVPLFLRQFEETGDSSAARKLLMCAASALRHGEPLSQPVATFIADGLDRIIEGDASGDAFGVRRGRGEKASRYKKTVRDFQYTMDVWERRSQGMTLENAIAAVADEKGENEATVRRAWEKKHHALRAILKLVHSPPMKSPISLG